MSCHCKALFLSSGRQCDWSQPLLWLWAQSNALNTDSVRRVKQNNNYSLITQPLAVEACWFAQTGCDVTGSVQRPHFQSNKGCKQLLFSCFVLSCLYILPSSPLSLSLLRIVISLPLSQERLKPTFTHSLSCITAGARQLIAQKACIRRDMPWQLRCSGQ